MAPVRDIRSSLAVYVVTSAELVPGRGHLEVAQAAIEGGATAVQLRAPELDGHPAELLELATQMAALCSSRQVLFTVNDAVEIAVDGGADGVHLGQEDELGEARARLGLDRVLGVSVGTPEQARTAEVLGADYLGVTVFSTPTKREARPLGLEGLREIVEVTSLPVVGIGGIDASNAREVLSAGAAGVAVVSAVGASEDPVHATRELAAAVASFFGRRA
jgi:thiamine-phosphate pyrophosphorylase